AIPKNMSATVVGIGIFDGVHLGHQSLLGVALKLAQQDHLHSVAYTFHPHPARVLNPPLAPNLLESVDQRVQRLSALGFDTCLVENFNKEFAATSPEDFVRNILVDKLNVRHVVVGEEFSFGRK